MNENVPHYKQAYFFPSQNPSGPTIRVQGPLAHDLTDSLFSSVTSSFSKPPSKQHQDDDKVSHATSSLSQTMSTRGRYLQEILKSLKEKGYSDNQESSIALDKVIVGSKMYRNLDSKTQRGDDVVSFSDKESGVRLDPTREKSSSSHVQKYGLLSPYFRFDNDLRRGETNPAPISLQFAQNDNLDL